MRKNFAIAGLFRSGTKFLATTMDLSETWTVMHEGPKAVNDRTWPIKKLQPRFDRDHYGEVSHHLTPIIEKLNVARKGVILRNPVDVWISIMTRRSTYGPKARPYRQWIKTDLEKMKKDLRTLLRLAKTDGYRVIDFALMTQDVGYLQDVLTYFGVEDVTITRAILANKINHDRTVQRKTMADFSPEVRGEVMRLHELYHKERP